MFKIFFLCFLILALTAASTASQYAFAAGLDDPPPSNISKNWYWAAGGLAVVGALAQVEDSNITFAALEAGAAFYMMNEWYKDDSAPLAQLITPLALTTLALINVTLLRDDDTSSGDIFRYNAGGLSLITLNYFWSY